MGSKMCISSAGSISVANLHAVRMVVLRPDLNWPVLDVFIFDLLQNVLNFV